MIGVIGDRSLEDCGEVGVGVEILVGGVFGVNRRGKVFSYSLS